MRISVKTLALITITVFQVRALDAQLTMKPFNRIGNEIKTVISHYPYCFEELTGDLLAEQTQHNEYVSTLHLSGAEECKVMVYSSGTDPVCSWEALMLTTEDFEKAVRLYKSLFNQIHNLTMRPMGVTFRLKGDYEKPVQEKKFIITTLKLYPEDESIKNMRIEIAMSYALTEWKVKILVYDRERRDDERGKIREN